MQANQSKGARPASRVVLLAALAHAAAASLSGGCGAVAGRAPRDAAGTSDGGGGAADSSDVAIDAADPDAPAACVPEQCNGLDDDCDGVVDNGCPLDGEPLSTRPNADMSPVFGSVTEVAKTLFTDGCPDGQAVIGFLGDSGAALDAVGVKCGTLVVREDRSTVPYRYTIAVTTGTAFAPVGGPGGAQNSIDSTLGCALNEVVTAVHTWSEPAGGACAANGCAMATGAAAGCPVVYGFGVTCTRYTISGQPGAFALTVASGPTDSARVGGTGRTAAPATQAAFACGSAGALREAEGAFGRYPVNCTMTVVTGLQFVCANPVIPLR